MIRFAPHNRRSLIGLGIMTALLGTVSLLVSGCLSAEPPTSSPSQPLRDSPAEPTPATFNRPRDLEPDPGPASSRGRDPRFDAPGLTDKSGWMRILVELRDQVDADAVLREGWVRGESRQAIAERFRTRASEISAAGRSTLERLLIAQRERGDLDTYRFLRWRNRVFVSARAAVLVELEGHPAVARVIPEFDGVREAKRARYSGGNGLKAAPPVPEGDSWGIAMLGLRALWAAGVDGRGTVVGVLDSGVMGDHLAFARNRQPGASWFDPVTGQPDPIDTVPHGSHVLACAVGGEVSGRALGVAPAARWVAALANYQNSYNNVNMSLAAEWLIFVARPDVVLGAWGHGKANCDDRDRPMVAAFRAAGMIPVYAAGNDGPGPGSGQAPAGLAGFAPDGRGVFSVAAIDPDKRIVPQSSRGPSPCGRQGVFPDVAAPGWQVTVPGAPKPESLTLSSGTSMAVGWVGGAAALVLQVRPELPVPAVEEILMRTADDLGASGPDNDFGHGLINPTAAVEASRTYRWGP